MTDISKLFSCNGRYSSTENMQLMSTTFSMAGSHYCIHCGSGARNIQGGLSRHNRYTEFEHYETTDRRCTCDGAIEEMIENIAVNKLGVETEEKYVPVPRDVYLKVLSSFDDRYLPLDGELDKYHMIPSITIASPGSVGRFLKENNQTIKRYMADDFYVDHPLRKLIERVDSKISELRNKHIEQAKQTLERAERTPQKSW